MQTDGTANLVLGIPELAVDRPAPSESEQRAQRLARRFELLSQTASDLLAGEDPQAMVERLCHRVMDHLDCQVFFNFLMDPKAGRLHLNACAGIGPAEAKRVEWLDMGTAICGCVARAGQRMVAFHVATTPDPRTDLVRSYGVEAYACHPLLARGQVIGTLSFGTRTRTIFTEDELSVMKAVTDQIAMAMERIKLLEDARRQADELEKASKAKDRFLAMLSHELRTPLTPVLLTASMLEHRQELPSDMREDLSMIRRHVQLEARIIDDLLDLTSIAKGKLQYEFHPIDLHPLARAAADLCGRGEGAPILLELSADQSHVRGDATRLQQVLWNLLSNARKYTPVDGRITIRSAQSSDGGILLEILDTGEGIDPSMLETVFNAFEQEERQFGGLGVGLAISRAIAEAHAGTLTARSAGRGKGSIFTLKLPIMQGSGFARSGSDSASLDPNVRTLNPLRILLVEDHDTTMRIMAKLLAGLGHQVQCAGDVASAIRAAHEGTFDLVISDLGLPDGSGHELMRYLSLRHGLRGIALSGFGTEEDLLRSGEAGFVEHLTKPVDLQRLRAAVHRATLTPS